MTRSVRQAALAAAGLTALGFGAQVHAQDAAAAAAETPAVTLTGYATLISDYRFRGVSLSNNDPAIQGSFQATTRPGFFVAVWASSLARYGDLLDGDGNVIDPGATTEIDVYGGWSKTFGPVTPTVGLYGYLYPGGHNVNYYEIYGSLAFALAGVSFTAGINYAPSQESIGGTDNTYLYLQPSYTFSGFPVTIKGSIGYEDGAGPIAAGGLNNKVDWMIGADFKYKIFTLGVQYIGNNEHNEAHFNRDNLKDTALVSLTASF